MNNLLVHYPNPFHFALMITHVFAGVIAPLAATLALLVIKGARVHRRLGQIFFWCNAYILVSTIGLCLFRFSFFMLVLGSLSFYTAFTGYRVLSLKRPAQNQPDHPLAMDWVSAGVAFGLGLALVVASSASLIWPTIDLGTFGAGPYLGILFGLLLTVIAFGDWQRYRYPPTERNAWWMLHMRKMMGSYIAMLTAFFLNVVIRLMPPDLARFLWLLPAAILLPVTFGWIGQYRRKFSSQG